MWGYLLISVFVLLPQDAHLLKPCPGDTRGDKRCNHDPTHRVCAKIGDPSTSFWRFTGQSSWCGSISDYGDSNDGMQRCPASSPTWCICKWATANWIKGEGCNENIQFDCEATDVCNLKASYKDFDVDLKPAHDCMMIKCKKQWDACGQAAEKKSYLNSDHVYLK
ncbi:uncharacterized protein [Acropora muricata]|uniref:uncharacterized protein n=1 Tax=Acropora muricata TaxID=159855 RepID=UPI0034E51956